MIKADLIAGTLEQVAERCGDPKDRIYARLFELHPEFEELFVLDTDGGVRGSMLESSFNCLIGIAEEAATPRFELQSARLAHEGYGVRETELDAMFVAIRDVCRDVLGRDWTGAMETEWACLLEKMSRTGLQES